MRKRLAAVLAALSLALAFLVGNASPASANLSGGNDCPVISGDTRVLLTSKQLVDGSGNLWGMVYLYGYKENVAHTWTTLTCAETATFITTLTSKPHYSYAQTYDNSAGLISSTVDTATLTTVLNLAHWDSYLTQRRCMYARGRIDDLAGHTVVYNTPATCMVIGS